MHHDSVSPLLTRPSSLGESAYAITKRLIIENKLTPGEVITENALAEKLGISRSPVRYALARLQDDGFVEVEPLKSARVTKLDASFIQELYSVRAALEARAARESTGAIPEAELARMEAALNSVKATLMMGDASGFNDLEEPFHSLLIDSSENRLLKESLARLKDHTQRVRNVFRLTATASHKLEEWEEHLRILEAVRTRDPRRVETLVDTHIMNVADRLLADLAQHAAESKAQGSQTPGIPRGRSAV